MIPFDPMRASLDPGISLVEASAGTGKTYSIALTVIRLLLDRNEAGADRVPGVGKILVVTFTNAATDELITRVRTMLRDTLGVFTGLVSKRTPENESLFCLLDLYGAERAHRLHEALASLDQLSIFTIHGFCKRVLEESALESGTSFDASLIEDETLLIDAAARDWWRRAIYENPRLAALAVHDGWRYDMFLSDLKRTRRWPDTRIDPDQPLAEALERLDAAVAAFGAAWNGPEAEHFLGSLAWYADAELRDPVKRQRIVELATSLARGEHAAVPAVATQLTTGAMLAPNKGIQKKSHSAFEAAAPEFVAAADDVARGLVGVRRALRVSCIENVDRCFAVEKNRQNVLGFDDLLRRLHRALTTEGPDGHLALAIRNRYHAALIDEFQDTDPYQFPIFSTAFTGKPLFLIGDPKQAIYGFRGADVFAYLAAARQATRQYTLATNWRSTPNMVAAVNALFGRRPSAFLLDRIAYPPAKAARPLRELTANDSFAALHWWFLPPGAKSGAPACVGKGDATTTIHAAVVHEIVRLLGVRRADGTRIRPGTIAVLVRASREGTAIREALREANVPSVVAGLGDILQSPELRDLEWLLRAVAAPQDGRAARAALTTELWGAGAAEIERLSRAEHEEEWQRVAERFSEAREAWVRHGFMRMIQKLLVEHRVAERLLAHVDGERRLTNLRHAVELLHHVSVDARLSPEGLLLWIARSRSRKSADSDRTELRLESDDDAVQIVTIHKSKGLEYDIVFCPDLWEARRAAPDAPVLVHVHDGTVVFDHGSDDRPARGRLEAAEQLAEDLRLAYVALTRARLRCYVAWGPIMNGKSRIGSMSSSLGYLLRDQHEPGRPEDVAERVSERLAESIGDWQASLESLIASSGGTMTYETLGANEGMLTRWQPPVVAAAGARIRDPLPNVAQLRTWRISSFTSFTAGRHTDDARDVSDAGAAVIEDATERRDDRGDFLTFPAGRQAGIALHALFERLDFSATAEGVRSLAVDVLCRARLANDDADRRIDAVAAMVGRVVSSVMPGTSVALRSVRRASTLREWEFHLPLGVVNRATLADLFASFGGDVARRYAPTLRALDIDRAYGFLTGVVDLTFQHDEKWYIVDWKSNHLGYDPARYAPTELEAEMFHSHYVLQYHIYVVALHRFLKLRQPDYDYGNHVGGVCYAFLRGVDGARNGWFADRPSRELVDALDTLLDAPGPGAMAEVRI